jgi:ferrous iron transport protein B
VAAAALTEFASQFSDTDEVVYNVTVDEDILETEDQTFTGADLAEATQVYADYGYAEPDPADYGIWVPGIPALIESGLSAVNCADWLQGLILDGIVAGVGAVLGFVPQMLVLFIFLAFLESCGYMARIAFVMDRIFRRFGLSGKSFIPMLIGTGCGVPGIMASRTIEAERDRRMTVMTTTFIPCSAKLPIIGAIAGAFFGGEWWVAPSTYFLGVVSIIVSGIMLKKSKMFEGDPAPFVMELPAYHLPTVGNILRSMWERAWSFIKKAGTIILLATILVWFLSYFGFVDGHFQMLTEDQMDSSILGVVGSAICWIFIPQGFANWQFTVATLTGLIAKENVIGTLGILFGGGDASVYETMVATVTPVAAYAYLAFNLLCAPCFAAMGAMRREMNSPKWTWFAIGYQCGFAYIVSLIIYQLGSLFAGSGNPVGVVVAVILVALIIFQLVRPEKKAQGKKSRSAVASA